MCVGGELPVELVSYNCDGVGSTSFFLLWSVDCLFEAAQKLRQWQPTPVGGASVHAYKRLIGENGLVIWTEVEAKTSKFEPINALRRSAILFYRELTTFVKVPRSR
jgi:hypothetical protein